MAKLYKTTGEIIDIEPENGTDFTSKELEKYVGGAIWLYNLPNGVMVVNDIVETEVNRGRLENRRINDLATNLIGQFYLFELIVGDAVVCGINDIK